MLNLGKMYRQLDELTWSIVDETARFLNSSEQATIIVCGEASACSPLYSSVVEKLRLCALSEHGRDWKIQAHDPTTTVVETALSCSHVWFNTAPITDPSTQDQREPSQPSYEYMEDKSIFANIHDVDSSMDKTGGKDEEMSSVCRQRSGLW